LDVNSLSSFLGLMAQIIGTIAALMGAFLLFWYQSIESRKQNWYATFKAEVANLRQIFLGLSQPYSHLRPTLAHIVSWLEGMRLRDLPIMGDDWEEKIHKFISVAESKGWKFQDLEGDDSSVDVILLTLGRIEEATSEYGILCIEIIIASFFLRTIIKLLFILIAILCAILVLNLAGQSSFIIQYSIIMVLGLLYAVIIGILELILHFRDYYRELEIDVVDT
jgi:hypothetical protein